MKKVFLSVFVFLGLTSLSAHAQNREFEVLPPNHWAYSALAKLGQIQEEFSFLRNSSRPMNYYEFAVFTVRWLDRHPRTGNSPQELQAKDIFTAFEHEFALEIKRLDERTSSSGRVEAKGQPIKLTPFLHPPQHVFWV